MAKFKLEIVLDQKTGRYFSELYYPDNALTPVAVTKPIYLSHEDAQTDAVRMSREQLEAAKNPK